MYIKAIRKFLRRNLEDKIANRILKNIYKKRNNKSALISYTVFPFYGNNRGHANWHESRVIAGIFDSQGYNVDIVNYTCNAQIDYEKYDVIFGFGNPLENSFAYKNKILRVCYATGAHVFHQNQAEIERVKCFNLKYSARERPQRIVPWTWSQSTTMSDALIILGNEWTRSTYKSYTDIPIYNLNAIALINNNLSTSKKDFESAKNNFLWFGSHGLIHKGLDLCLEFFGANRQFKLHVCGPYEPGFYDVFEKCFRLDNVINHGFVDVESDRFPEITAQCAFALLPTCSEGQTTSLLTAMGAGLIPLSTIYSGVDFQNYGYCIDELTVEALGAAIGKAQDLTASQISKKSMKIQEYIREVHSIDRYRASLDVIIKDIMC